jgi:hypothetical protein
MWKTAYAAEKPSAYCTKEQYSRFRHPSSRPVRAVQLCSKQIEEAYCTKTTNWVCMDVPAIDVPTEGVAVTVTV